MDTQKQQARQSMLSLILTIVIPSILLIKGNDIASFTPMQLLLLALLFPAAYAVYEKITAKQISFMPVLGFVSVLLTGGIATLQLPPKWIAIKESAIPLCIGLITFGSCFFKKPGITFILNSFLDLQTIARHLNTPKKKDQCHTIYIRATFFLSCSFFLSAFLNFVLATLIVKSTPGSAAFNEELGVLTALSYPVIAIPSMIVLAAALYYVVHKLKHVTTLSFTELLHSDLKEATSKKPSPSA